MADLKAPYFSYETLKERANAFLAQYHSSGELPIPVEEIIDLQLGINIIPIRGLQRVLSVDAFLSQDLKSISIDEAVFEGNQHRYRFSLAHELAHLVLHREIYKELGSDSISEWKESILRIPDREYRYLEIQANKFAGLILVPPGKLAVELEKVRETFEKNGVAPEFLYPMMAEELSYVFDTSSQTVEIRMSMDGFIR